MAELKHPAVPANSERMMGDMRSCWQVDKKWRAYE